MTNLNKIKSTIRILSAFIVTVGLFSNIFYSSISIKYTLVILCLLNSIMPLFEIKSSKSLYQMITSSIIPLIIMIVVLIIYK